MKKDNQEKREMELGSEYYKLWKRNAKQSMYFKDKIQKIFITLLYQNLEVEHKKSYKKKDVFEVAKKKLQTVEVFMNVIQKELAENLERVGEYYRDKFIKAVERVVVMTR